jgi:hypothetical protein
MCVIVILIRSILEAADQTRAWWFLLEDPGNSFMPNAVDQI